MAEPVSLFEAREHLKLDTTNGTHPDDGLVQGLIAAARVHVENATGRALLTATKDAYFDGFDPAGFTLPDGPVSEVTWVKYLADDGTLTTLATTVYRTDLESLRARITLDDGQVWPSYQDVTNSVTVRYVVGQTTPAPLKHAIMLLAAHWYENRVPVAAGSLAELPHMVAAMLAPYTVYSYR